MICSGAAFIVGGIVVVLMGALAFVLLVVVEEEHLKNYVTVDHFTTFASQCRFFNRKQGFLQCIFRFQTVL